MPSILESLQLTHTCKYSAPGSIEAVETRLLRLRNEGQRLIPSVAYEKTLLESLPRFLAIQKELGVEPPLFIMLSLLEVSGYKMAVNFRILWGEHHPINRDTLIMPEVLLETFDCDPEQVMHPLFDAVWNATGWPRSMNYDENDKWVGQG